MNYWTNGIATLFHADARAIPLEDQSVHCVVTSPPYYGLRVYKAGDGAIGLEQTPDEYLDAMMEVFDEVWRVLRDDGVCWVNLGDSYSAGGRGGGGTAKQESNKGAGLGPKSTPGFESGQLLGIPWRFALRMQERGWILRSDVIWAKSAPMPESLNGTRWERCRVKVGVEWADCPGCDKCKPNGGYVLRNGSWRCTSSYEHIFQFVKSMGYYSDGEAVKLPNLSQTIERYRHKDSLRLPKAWTEEGGEAVPISGGKAKNFNIHESGANRRDVWRDIKPEPYGGEHYATYPSDLPRICIQASTSEYGVCSVCGAQWARVMSQATGGTVGRSWHDHQQDDRTGQRAENAAKGGSGYQPSQTLDWKPTCTCKRATWARPVVCDPFVGTGSTLLAAMRLGRQSYGVDLSKDYLNQAVKRLSNETLPMRVT